MRPETLYLVIPAYNEESNIEKVVRQWYPVLKNASAASRMVIADSGSTDRTHAILLALQKEFPQLEILSDTGRQHGPKVIALYAYAIRCGAAYIFQTDADGQTDAAEFEGFWALRDKYDAVLGYRRVRGDGRARAFVEHIVCLLLKLYFGVRVPDANAPFRLMRAQLVERYLERLPKDYTLPNIMLTTYFAYYKEKLTFREISFKPRQGGKNSIDLVKITGIGWNALKDFRRFKKEMCR